MKHLTENDFVFIEKREIEELLEKIATLKKERQELEQQIEQERQRFILKQCEYESVRNRYKTDEVEFRYHKKENEKLQKENQVLMERVQEDETKYLELDSILTETKMILHYCKQENESLAKENIQLKSDLKESLALHEQSIDIIGEQAEEYEVLKNSIQSMNQEPKKDTSQTAILALHEQLLNLGGSEGHCTIEGIQGKKDAIAVISVYHGQRPAHEVLENLDTWAKQTEQTKVVEKINQLVTPLDDVEIPW